MKFITIVTGIIAVCVAVMFACPKGSSEWRGGCVVDIEPEIAKPVQPSDEKPPSDKMPSWQREGVTLSNAPSMADDDAKADAEKRDADIQGKQMAGIKPRIK